ncbi:hypothetical protein EON65_27160 [archaeon]|nr:MAG: hypothetical protein EON65_27160 [archaeon]
MALLMLGFTSSAGGQAQAATDSNGDDEVNKALSAGYGFGAFCFILAFFLFLAAAVYVSPLFCGSPNEKKMIRAPQEIDTSK